MEHVEHIAAILGIGTAVPGWRLDQETVTQRMGEALKDSPDSARFARRIFRSCGVETRYTCEPNLLEDAANCAYLPHAMEAGGVPTTAERMAIYQRESVPLGLLAAERAIEDGRTDVSSITHLITVSCTGQFLPGLDAELLRLIGLSPSVYRIPLTFIGCAAAVKAISLAGRIVSADPSAKVLIVSVELCTLHIQPTDRKEDLFAASFFGDGASACIVGSAGADDRYIFRLNKDDSALLPDSAEEMIWNVGNFGFELYLSPNIPRLIGSMTPQFATSLLNGRRPELWAIHPGGKGIIDKLQEVFGLTDTQSGASRHVLRHYGNMSSATILFVLAEMRRELRASGRSQADGVVLAFGPGLTLEMLGVTYMLSVESADSETRTVARSAERAPEGLTSGEAKGSGAYA